MDEKSLLSALKTHLEYHPDGYFIWKVPNHPRFKVGDKAGGLSPNGRYKNKLLDHEEYTYRLVWLWHHGKLPEQFVDHIDGDKTNDRIENLRAATNSQNQMNRGTPSNNKSGYKGVSETRHGRWMVMVGLNGKNHYGGTYTDVHEAGKAASDLRKKLHGEWAV